MKISAYTLLASFAMTLLFSQTSFADKPEADKSKGDQATFFKVLDKNNDGNLTKDEVSEDQKNHFERLLRLGDKDNNGELSLEEFKNALPKKDETVTTEKGLNKESAPVADKKKNKKEKKKDVKSPEILFKKLDKNMDGKLSGDELTKNGKTPGFLKRVYASLDKKEGEEITQAEFSEAIGKFAKNPKQTRTTLKPETPEKGKKNKGQGDKPEKGNHPPLPKFYMLLDGDHDHKLSKEELSKAVDLIAKLDKDNDGALSPHEILGPPPRGLAGPGQKGKNKKPGAANQPGQPGKKKELGGAQRIDKMIEKLDKDSDGKLSKEELPPFMQKNLEKIDTDGDGSVSKEELTKSFEERFKNRKKKEN